MKIAVIFLLAGLSSYVSALPLDIPADTLTKIEATGIANMLGMVLAQYGNCIQENISTTQKNMVQDFLNIMKLMNVDPQWLNNVLVQLKYIPSNTLDTNAAKICQADALFKALEANRHVDDFIKFALGLTNYRLSKAGVEPKPILEKLNKKMDGVLALPLNLISKATEIVSRILSNLPVNLLSPLLSGFVSPKSGTSSSNLIANVPKPINSLTSGNPFLQSLSGSSGLSGLPDLSSFPGLSGLPGLSDLNNLPGLNSFPGLNSLPGLSTCLV
ncbi:hypothetical protein XELAEV_18017279mg [Xenopus laevis]|uniref:Uncharacterized protein n=1 Tax=Xenopus laevis TaxID=8355 RepID=A0A974DB03_XENLA|nr:hypothetical protein XELAEV_18017279mg [Xenopus laevis]